MNINKPIRRAMKTLIHILNQSMYLMSAMIWRCKRYELFQNWGRCGKNVNIGRHWSIPKPQNIFLGNNIHLGENVRLSAMRSKIEIKDYVVFGPNVSIHGGNHRYDIVGKPIISVPLSEKRQGIDDKDVIIEEDVWVGNRAIILQGVTIGRGSIIAAGSVVTKSIPPYSIVGGVPAKILKVRFTQEQIKEHERILYKKIP